MTKMFPAIDPAATGKNITRLRKDRGLPAVDNLYALGALLDVPLEEILVPCKPKLNMVIITTTKVVVCTDPRRVITGFAPKGASKVWHRITLTGRR